MQFLKTPVWGISVLKGKVANFKLFNQSMLLRVVNNFAGFEQNQHCKNFFFCLSIRLGYTKRPKWGFWKSFTRSSLEVKGAFTRHSFWARHSKILAREPIVLGTVRLIYTLDLHSENVCHNWGTKHGHSLHRSYMHLSDYKTTCCKLYSGLYNKRQGSLLLWNRRANISKLA